MRLSLCTISFRHQLIDLKDIAFWARDSGFQGIELWGAHARNQSPLALYNAQWMAAQGLSIPMVSDYLPLHDLALLRQSTLDLCRQAQIWGATKMRTFAGMTATADACPDQRRKTARALREACAIAQDNGLKLLIETHPGTLADSLAATCDLISETNHPGLAVNFDAIHLWEAGDDPVVAHKVLSPYIAHYHLKNITSRDRLGVFAPANIYSAAGDRDGLVSLFDGAYDYRPLLTLMAKTPQCEASLEWFGGNVFAALKTDLNQIRSLTDLPHDASANAG